MCFMWNMDSWTLNETEIKAAMQVWLQHHDVQSIQMLHWGGHWFQNNFAKLYPVQFSEQPLHLYRHRHLKLRSHILPHKHAHTDTPVFWHLVEKWSTPERSVTTDWPIKSELSVLGWWQGITAVLPPGISFLYFPSQLHKADFLVHHSRWQQ